VTIQPGNSLPVRALTLKNSSDTSPRQEATSATSFPVDRMQVTRQPLSQNLQGRNLQELRQMAGVKKKGWLKRTAQAVGSWMTGARLALAVGPSLGHTIIAKHLSELESLLTGKPPLAPIDYLRERRPEAYVQSLGTLLKAASAPAEQAQGLSPTDLLTAEQHFYQAMQPVKDENGHRAIAPYLRELGKEPFRNQREERAAFVFLGEKRQQDANSVTELWNSPDRPRTNPFPEDDQRHLIWDRLEVEARRGLLPVFIDFDGDYSTFTGTEFVAKRTLASLGERNNSLGDGFTESGMYFAWLGTRLESTSRELLPYLEGQDKALFGQVEGFKQTLTPPWLDGTSGIGPWPALEKVREIPARLANIKKSKGEAAWVDSLTSLDRDVLSGVQTHWIKLLRELPREARQELTAQLADSLFEWNLREPGTPAFDQVSPPDAPLLTELSGGENPRKIQRPYDRSVALKEITDHTLDGLGIAERRQILEQIKTLASHEVPRLQARESRLSQALGQSYPGLEVNRVLDGSLPRAELKQGLKALRDFADRSPRDPLAQEARRHGQLLGFLYEMDHRYGELDEVMSRLAGDFAQHPFGVSEFFIPPTADKAISPVTQLAQRPVRMGNPDDPNPMKVSQVFEGGGGRGFAYVECLKQFQAAFANSPNGYEIDEFIGTSAGSMMALLLAAGFQPDELRKVLEAVDFTTFNGDAVWMMGGVDPKVRGIERNGLFSTQKMYQTFSQLLSEKLGIEGRPILFRDLPHKLKMITTLVNTDMPTDHPLREQLDSDGRMTWSTDGTPNVDVVGVLVASASVPGFFQSPQILVSQPGEDGEVKRARLQMQDGGIVDNLSISSASQEEKDRALILLPSHTRTRDPETGEWVGLETLNFDTGNLDLVDAHNRKLYGKFMPQMDNYLQRMKEHGTGRAVVAFNLVRENQQSLPAIQGSSESLSLKGLIHAKELGLPVLDKDKGDRLIRASQRPPSLMTNVLGGFFDQYIDNRPGEGDGQGKLHRVADGFHFRVGQNEEADLFEAVRSTGAAALSASQSEYAERRFERPDEPQEN
jgi:predicted acylesterase/phospholipase RssA